MRRMTAPCVRDASTRRWPAHLGHEARRAGQARGGSGEVRACPGHSGEGAGAGAPPAGLRSHGAGICDDAPAQVGPGRASSPACAGGAREGARARAPGLRRRAPAAGRVSPRPRSPLRGRGGSRESTGSRLGPHAPLLCSSPSPRRSGKQARHAPAPWSWPPRRESTGSRWVTSPTSPGFPGGWPLPPPSEAPPPRMLPLGVTHGALWHLAL